MRWLSLWLCVILTGLHALAQETLADDPRLQTRITVWLKMEPLRDTLRAISKQTGVSLRCQDAIQHHKVSVFVEDRPPPRDFDAVAPPCFGMRGARMGGSMCCMCLTRRGSRRRVCCVRLARRVCGRCRM